MKDYHINIFFSEDDRGYIADIPDLEACSAFGKTPDEALHEVQLAKTAWLEAARQEGKPEDSRPAEPSKSHPQDSSLPSRLDQLPPAALRVAWRSAGQCQSFTDLPWASAAISRSKILR